MKVIGVIPPGISVDDVGQEIFDALCNIYPQGKQTKFFGIKQPVDNSAFVAVIELLGQHGFRPWNTRSDKTDSEFTMRLEREYTKKDLDAARYLTVYPLVLFRSYERNAADEVQLVADNIKAKAKAHLALPTPPVVVVSSVLKQRIEDAGTIGAKFRPTEVIAGEEVDPAPFAGMFWEWVSDIQLPWLCPPCVLLDGMTSMEVTADSPRPYLFSEGLEPPGVLYHPPQLHYKAKDIEFMGPFDVAMVRERLTGPHSQPLVVSNRIYKICVEMGVSVNWMPVEIVDE